jgi:hypothetical protein
MSIKRLCLAAIAGLVLVKYLGARGSSSGLLACRRQTVTSETEANGGSVEVDGRAVDARRLVRDVASMLGLVTGCQSSFHNDTSLRVLDLAMRFEGRAPQSIEELLERLEPHTFISSHDVGETWGLAISDILAVYMRVKSFQVRSRDAAGEFHLRLRCETSPIRVPGFFTSHREAGFASGARG